MTQTQTGTVPRSRLRIGPLATFFILPVATFVLTSLPGLNSLTPFATLAIIATLISLRFFRPVSLQVHAILWVLLVLTLVGSTGWFFSPFFFALYLLGIALGFLYSPATAVSFTVALITMFAFSVGEVNPTADFLVLLSLFSVIPITLALRKSFLLVQQAKKGILILEQDERKDAGITSLDAIMANRVNQIGILLRQPLTYLKQGLALISGGHLKKRQYPDVLNQMQRSVDDLFTMVKEFESGATRNVLLGRGMEQQTPELAEKVAKRRGNGNGSQGNRSADTPD